MLNLTSEGRHRNCRSLDRRELLQVGSLALGGMSLPQLLAGRAAAASAGAISKETSVVLLFLTGGPSQIETFDPKMTAPSGIRSVTGEVSTRLTGVTFGGTFSQMARQADRMAVVRSFALDSSDHTRGVQNVMRGGSLTEAGMGAVCARLRGFTHPATGMPTNIYLSQAEVDRQFNKERLRLLEAAGPGSLGTASLPFEPFGNGPVNRNLQLNIHRARLDDRRALRRALDRIHRTVDLATEMTEHDRFEQQAFDLILGKSKQAFDLSREDPRLVARYDTSRFITGISKNRNSSLGKQMLLARRLCEAGCGFVTIHNPGWDMHGGPTQMNMPGGMEQLGSPVDHAVATFLEDVEQRGLSEKILLIITGEFGRTPKVKPDGGRDHWPRLSTLAFAGGGLRMGQVIGRSNARAEEPLSNRVTLENLFSTVLHVLFDVPKLRLSPEVPRDLAISIERGEPIEELVS